MAAKMERIAIATSSSIKVKPICFFKLSNNLTLSWTRKWSMKLI